MTGQLFEDIAPAQALGIVVSNYGNGRIELTAPLAPNLNDKGTAFAGSVSSMLTLAGWAIITLRLSEAGIDADVMVVKSETDFSAPAQSGLKAEARLPDADVPQILSDLENRKRSRVCIRPRLSSGKTLCASMTAHYAVFLKT